MSMHLSMWNFQKWFQQRELSHVFSIHQDTDVIRNVQLESAHKLGADDAILSDTSAHSEFSCVLAHADDRIFFRHATVFEVMDEINYMFTIYRHWVQALTRVNLSHGNLTTLLTLCNELLSCPIIIYHGDELLASTPQYQDEADHIWSDFCQLSFEKLYELLPPDSGIHAQYASRTPAILHSPVYHGKQVLMANVVAPDARCLHVIAYASKHPFSPADIRMMQCLSEAITQNLILHQKLRPQQFPDMYAFFAEYQQTMHWNAAHAEMLLQQFAWKKTDTYTVFRIELKNGGISLLLDQLQRHIKQLFPQVLCLLQADSLQIICNTAHCQAASICDTLIQLLSDKAFVMSQSNYSTDFHALPQLLAQAEHTLQQARLRNCHFLASGEIMSDFIYQRLHEDRLIQSLVHPAIHVLCDLDCQQQSHYCETLKTYLSYGGNCNATAKALHIHRNTLLNRIDKILTITGVSLDQPAEQEALYLSMIVADLPVNTEAACPSTHAEKQAVSH